MDYKAWMMSPPVQQLVSRGGEIAKKCLSFLEEYAEHYRDEIKKNGRESAAASNNNDVDLAFKQHVNASEENRKYFNEIACSKGCYYCCLIHVNITKEEAALIVSYCKSNKIKIDKKKMMRQRKKEGHNWGELPEKQQRCSFLNENNECSIYPVRPTNCRKYHVLWDAEQCNPAANKGGEVPVFISPMAELMSTAAMTATEECGSLPQMLLKALKEK